MRRCHTSHGSTLLARDAQTPGRTTATRAGRTNGRAKARRQVRHSVEQLAAAEGAQRGNWPLVTSCNGKAPARSSRAAREWYSRRVSWDPSTKRVPLCPPLCGFVSVKANLNGPTISLRGRKVKSPLYPGARGRPRGPPLPGWRLYRIPRNTRHCRGGACPRPGGHEGRPYLVGVYRVPRDTRRCRGGACPRPQAATRAAPTWLGAYRVPHDTRRCRGGACPRPREAPRAAPAWLGAYRVPHDTRHCMGGACPRPPI